MKYHPSQFAYVLFDLDDTLYPKEAGLMEILVERMLLFMTHKLGIPADDAITKKHYYRQKYGTTLGGLMAEYQIDPDEYLAFVHDVNPRDFFGASPPLNRMLKGIPLSKVIFTNSDQAHSERVLNTLQVRPHFDQIIDITLLNFENKPKPTAYKQVLQRLKVSGDRCIMIDDLPRNLFPAKDLGMITILTGSGSQKVTGIDFAVPTIFHVEQILRDLLSLEKPNNL